jgi:hypothetical protein
MLLGLLLFKLKQDYGNITDHTLIAYTLNTKYKQNVTKKDIDRYYGFDDTSIIIHEDYELESRKQKFKLQL